MDGPTAWNAGFSRHPRAERPAEPHPATHLHGGDEFGARSSVDGPTAWHAGQFSRWGPSDRRDAESVAKPHPATHLVAEPIREMSHEFET